MNRTQISLSAALAVALLGAAAMGVGWTAVLMLLFLGVVAAGWFIAGSAAQRDIDRLGGDGDSVRALVTFAGPAGLIYWRVKRRALINQDQRAGRALRS